MLAQMKGSQGSYYVNKTMFPSGWQCNWKKSGEADLGFISSDVANVLSLWKTLDPALAAHQVILHL